jgi:hypothetical protein
MLLQCAVLHEEHRARTTPQQLHVHGAERPWTRWTNGTSIP